MTILDQQNRILKACESASPSIGFGDESVYRETLVYAFAGLPRQSESAALAMLADVRKKFAIPETARLHCRTFFSGDSRKKLGLSFLSRQDIEQLYSTILDELKKLTCECRFSFTKRPDSKTITLMQPHFPALQNTDKGLLVILLNCCFSQPPKDSLRFKIFDAELWVDVDKTPVEWFDVKRQFVNLSKGFSQVNSSEGKIDYISPHVSTWKEQPLLQIADLLAYVWAHAIQEERDCKKGLFYRLSRKIPFSYAEYSIP